jgi:PAS domain S-box-containing protein
MVRPKHHEPPTWKEIFENLILYLVSLLLIMVGLWIYTLRRQIRKRTRRLKEEVQDHRQTLFQLERQKNQLLQSEQQVRLLLNSTAEGIYGVDRKGHCTFINQAAIKLLGFISADEVLGQSMHHLMHHTHNDGSHYPIEACKIHDAILQSKGKHVEGEVFWRSDGTSFYSEYFAYPIIKGRHITGSVISFRDITLRYMAQQELLNLKNDLEKKVAERTAELEEKLKASIKTKKPCFFW